MNDASANPDPLAALDKMFELAVRLTEAMQRGLGERNLTASRAEVLLALVRNGPMVQRQLSESLRCTPRYVTALVDALEAEDLVRRGPHPTDRRATLVALTNDGATAAARMENERQQAARWLLGDLPAADLRTFMAVADTVLGRIAGAAPRSGEERPHRPEEPVGPTSRRRAVQSSSSPTRPKRGARGKEQH